MPAQHTTRFVRGWRKFIRRASRPESGRAYFKVRFYFYIAAIACYLLFGRTTRGFIWTSLALGVVFALYLRWRNRHSEIIDPKIQ